MWFWFALGSAVFAALTSILVYDAAYDAINDEQDVDAAIGHARKYFEGHCGAKPNWEYLSAGEAKAVRDISHYLNEQESALLE